MQVTETLSQGLKRGFTVVVPSAEIEGKRTAKLSEISRTLKLPGFRPGRVPMPVVRQRFGTAVMAEVLQESVDEAAQQVLTDRGLRAAMQPKIDVVNIPSKDDQTIDLEFKVEVELLPDITVPDFSALQLTRPMARVPDEAVAEALDNIAARQRGMEPIEEDRGAAKGEVLKADFTGRIDGTAFPGGAGTDTDIVVGGPGFIPGFTDQVEGMKAGETREIHVTFPEDYGAPELAGKAATFEIVAKSLSKPVPPVVDDALAIKIGFESLEELRGVITTQMQREFDQMSRMHVKRELLDILAKSADFPVPEAMADAEFGQIWQRVAADLKEGKADEDDRGKDEETLQGEYRAIAERRVRLGLLLSEVGRANGVTVGADEMTRAMRAEASRYQGQEAQVMEFFRKNPQAAESLRGPIFEDKVVDFILDQAKIEDRSVTPEELSADPAPPPATSDPAAPEAATPEAATPELAPPEAAPPESAPPESAPAA